VRDKKKGSGDFVKGRGGGGLREVATDVTEGGEENVEEEEEEEGAVARTKEERERVKRAGESGGQKARGGQHAEVIVMEM